ncbi:MAG: alpha/beta hydrolase [Bryobacteraceae bacterium]
MFPMKHIQLTLAALTIFSGFLYAQARTHQLVRHDDVVIESIVEGSGPVIVLLPSLGRDSEEFDPLATEIARAGFRVVRPRPRGFGRSAGPMEKLTLHDLAKDIAAVIGSQKSGPAIIAGHAYGHFVAKMVATDFPEQVKGVALVAAAQKNIDPKVRGWLAIATDPKQPEPERIKYLQMVFFAPGHDPRAWLKGFDPAAQKAQEIARDATPQADYWKSGNVPLLDIQAEYDPYRPRATQNQLIEEFGPERVTVVVIPNASHALPVENPKATAEALVNFAKKLK